MKNIFVFLFFCIVSLIIADGHDKKIDTFGKEYLPYNKDVILIYHSNFDETTSQTQIVNNIAILENKSDDFIYRQKYELRDDGLYISETYQKIHIFLFIKSERLVTYNHNILKIPFPLKTGQEWSCDRTEFCDGDSNHVSLVSKCVGTEELVVPAGKFTTMKIESTIKSTDGSTNFVEEWIAPNIGLVKVRAKIEGGGLTGTIRSILGYSQLVFELKEVKYK